MKNDTPQVKIYREGVLISESLELEDEENKSICQGKICTELTRVCLNTDLFRVINGCLYIYDGELGYFRKIREDREAAKVLSVVCDEKRKSRIASKTIDEVIRRLKNIEEINIEYDDINSNSQYVNCKNGVVDLYSGELLQHDKQYLFTYVINASYIDNNYIYHKYIEQQDYRFEEAFHNKNTSINSEVFDQFIQTSLEGNVEKEQLLYEIIGYLLSNYNNAKKAFVFLGKPHSGKSLLTKIISNLLGYENISNIPFHKLGDRFSNAELSIHKLNINAELDSTPVRKISNFKAIVGGDYLSAEFKGKQLFSFKAKIKLLFCGNYMPEIKDIESSKAFTDRLIFLMFNRSTPKEEMDYKLEEKLMNDIDIIFTKSMMALKRLVENNFNFTIPKDSLKFLNEYSNRQNHLVEFISECCQLGVDLKIHTKDLYKAYQKFCEENCITAYNLTKFGEYMSNVDGVYKSRFRLNGANLRGFEGITIKKFQWGGTEQ